MVPRTVLVDGEKKCTKCKIWKSIEEFIPAVNTSTGKGGMCKTCTYELIKDKYDNDPAFRKKFKEQQKKSRLKTKYGLTVKQFEVMLEEQGSKCAICFKSFGDHINLRPRVDHNHSTGDIRSLLCGQCNLGLGNFQENKDFLMSAISYLRDYE